MRAYISHALCKAVQIVYRTDAQQTKTELTICVKLVGWPSINLWYRLLCIFFPSLSWPEVRSSAVTFPFLVVNHVWEGCFLSCGYDLNVGASRCAVLFYSSVIMSAQVIGGSVFFISPEWSSEVKFQNNPIQISLHLILIHKIASTILCLFLCQNLNLRPTRCQMRVGFFVD